MTWDVDEQPSYDSMAELVFSVDLGTNATTFDAFFEWLLDHVPELNEAWSAALRDLGGGLSLLDVMAIHRWAVDRRVHRRTKVATASKLFELHPRTREMWAQLRQTARDAGLQAYWPQGAMRAAAWHRGLAELLASDDPEPLLAGCSPQQTKAYQSILEHRLHRGEGDVERIRRLQDALQNLERDDHPGLTELLVSDDPESLLAGCSAQQAKEYLSTLEHRLQSWESNAERSRRLHDVLRKKLGRKSRPR